MTAATSSQDFPDTVQALALESYGGFRLGEMDLALPMDALRDVIDGGTLLPLESAAACVAGGVDYGGTVVPVLDLRGPLGQALDGPQATRVLVMAHEGRLVGLLAHQVTGVFDDPVLVGSRILSTEAIAALCVHAARQPTQRPGKRGFWLRLPALVSGFREALASSGAKAKPRLA